MHGNKGGWIQEWEEGSLLRRQTRVSCACHPVNLIDTQHEIYFDMARTGLQIKALNFERRVSVAMPKAAKARRASVSFRIVRVKICPMPHTDLFKAGIQRNPMPTRTTRQVPILS